ncbi:MULTISPECIES: TolC family protein [Azohydromonas]|jgi:cobalt-zinc-cadmium efflux system outer membrane protein|uniref:TolC family protein n=1 Tax=Azohydromonas lata TaxID=45677 RepID=A0ABU5I9B4_9BURK|nr:MULTISPECIES: TolC family protein [Azohydromonas]MDZ5455695.1 TolC family protein [Azohydromonas lata]
MTFGPWGRGAGRAASALAWACLLAIAPGAHAQDATGTSITLRQVFDSAWQRQPEARGATARRDATDARLEAARSWTPEPAALELSGRSDRLMRNNGRREYVAGVAVPLWLPGERSRTQAVAEAERQAVDSHVLAAQLRLAGQVREAWWTVHRARIEATLAQARLANTQQLAADVARRVNAGDLSRADQHQAEGAAAAARAGLAEAAALQAQALQALRALAGIELPQPLPDTAEAMPAPGTNFFHPLLVELQDRAEVARRSQALASVQRRANPEIALASTRERDVLGEAYGQSLTVGVRIPFGSDSRHRARVAAAGAERIEAESALAVEQQRLQGELAAAQARMDGASQVAEAAAQRAALAEQTRGFIDKAFRLGEADLPTRLRVELEAFEAERLQARARIELAQALSQWRQAMGLLPE